jgi:transposase-like protein
MPVMAVNNENQQTGDYRSRPRWSAGKKMDAVLRLLRGEPLETLSRELGVEAHRLAAWRDDFLEGGKDALKGQRPDWSGDDRALRGGRAQGRPADHGERDLAGGGRKKAPL